MAYMLLIVFLFVVIPAIGVGIWLASSAIFGRILEALLQSRFACTNKTVFAIRKTLIICVILALIWKVIVLINSQFIIFSYYGAWVGAHVATLTAIIIAVVFAFLKKPENFDSFKARTHVGMLVVSVVYLAFVGIPHGWLTQGPRATWADELRITECYRYQYRLHVRRTWQTNAEITLVATDVENGVTHEIKLPTDDSFGNRFPSVPMRHDSTSAAWATLAPTDYYNIYILTTSVFLFYQRVAFEIDFYSGHVASIPPVDIEYLFYMPFLTTPDCLFNFRIEWWQLLTETMGNSELRLRMINVDTEEEHVFTLITGGTMSLPTSEEHQTLQHEEIRLEPTAIPHIYTAMLPWRFGVFEINLQENTSTLSPEYFYSEWNTTADGAFDYRVYFNVFDYRRRNFSRNRLSQSFTGADGFLQIRNNLTGIERSIQLPGTARGCITFEDVALSPLDWFSIHYVEGYENYIAEIILPINSIRSQRHIHRYTLITSPSMHFGSRLTNYVP